MNRRAFVTSAGVVVIGATPARALARPGLLRGGRFSEGVLSGDPTPTGITLATRLVGVEGTGEVTLELARDAGFDRVVSRSRLKTSTALGHAIKARVNGLKPHTRYWYRFAGRTAESSVGRFRTALPADSHQAVQFGIIAGLDYAAGYFNAAGLLADEDVDFVLNLGSYISAEESFSASDRVRQNSDGAAARSLPAYRQRYRDDRRDPGLRRLHAALPLVSTWDDGEVAGGYAGANTVGPVRRAAYRAWFENMPHYPKRAGVPQVYTRPQFGRTLDLFVCDTRQYRRPAPSESKTALLGSAQSHFVRGHLKDSTASWKLVATPAPVADLGDGADGWAGYQMAREELLATIDVNGIADVAFLTGGRRRFVAADVLDAHDKAIVPEFGCAGVAWPIDVTEEADAAPSHALEDDRSHHGYAVCVVSADQLDMRFAKVQTILESSSASDPDAAFSVVAGSRTLGAN